MITIGTAWFCVLWGMFCAFSSGCIVGKNLFSGKPAYRRMHRRISNQRKQLSDLNKALQVWKRVAEAYITEKSAIRAASLYTKEHKGELKRRRYAISLLKLIYAQGGQGEWKPVDWKQDQEALEQVIAREEAALADLLRGWREKGDGK